MVEHNPRATMPEDAKLVPVHEGYDHGYWGMVPDLEDNEVYTLTGAVKAQEQARKDHEKREAEWHKAASISEKSEDGAEKKPVARRSTSSAKKETN